MSNLKHKYFGREESTRSVCRITFWGKNTQDNCSCINGFFQKGRDASINNQWGTECTEQQREVRGKGQGSKQLKKTAFAA